MARKTYRIKNKYRFYTFIILVMLTVTLLAILLFQISAKANAKTDYKSVTVSHGDTLWKIAEENSNNSDIRQIVYQIRKINKLETANISPGQVIRVPLNK